MSVVVHPDEPIDSALRRLHREVLREDIIEILKEKKIYRKQSQKDAASRREMRKRKRKRRKFIRRMKNKGVARR